MQKLSRKLFFLLLISFACSLSVAQETKPLSSMEISGRIKIGKKSLKLKRKRFYLFRGGLKENKELIERLKSAEIISRDCFYSQMNASNEFICWLKEENCESPYCRQITETDVETVPEFKTAFQKGLRQFGRRRPQIARDWLTTNLKSNLRDGFYQNRKSLLQNILADKQPLQSSMTDSVTVKAIFIDIGLNLEGADGKKKRSETFLVSNILPMEIDDKSYIWACELRLRPNKTGKLRLKVPSGNKPVKGCEVIIKDLQTCEIGSCKK